MIKIVSKITTHRPSLACHCKLYVLHYYISAVSIPYLPRNHHYPLCCFSITFNKKLSSMVVWLPPYLLTKLGQVLIRVTIITPLSPYTARPQHLLFAQSMCSIVNLNFVIFILIILIKKGSLASLTKMFFSCQNEDIVLIINKYHRHHDHHDIIFCRLNCYQYNTFY